MAGDTQLEGVRDVAALRAGYLAVDTEDYTEMADRVERLTGDTDPFRAAARELLALSAWKNDETDRALEWISALEEDGETPVDVTRRVDLLADLIRPARAGRPADSEGSNQ